jgi:hypothetical protein
MQAKLRTTPAVHRTILCKIKSFCASLCKPGLKPCLHEALFYISQLSPGAPVPQVVSNHIQLLQYLGYQVATAPLQEQIPSGYTGRLSYWCEGKLQSQMYLKIRVRRVAKKSLVFQKIEPLDQQVSELERIN